ncbi:hypothetical protein DL766_002272 [Monosporascus sp. MC13-8B]|uniref:LysM domain-containing protein n=1 Tax=Monosporascus cannonballus TaxID=155416 RepID=A0ABY0HK11_9PEZI|nr:hypothetical protein DL762_000170 [Monosporascus cannonballus]RYO97324.1 hypothetical protein DL763_002784 [Monosporascus cannonballus]RYP35871.1 hypothetical protein DL766_002272 [Monosporascus sp. MC13-8B]
MRDFVVGVLAIAASLPVALASIAKQRIESRNATAADGVTRMLGGEPDLPHDEDTTPYTTWWPDNYGTEVCEEVPIAMEYSLRLARLRKFSTRGCRTDWIEAFGDLKLTGKPTTTNGPTPITTTTTAIKTGWGDACSAIAKDHHITSADPPAWNPEIKPDFTGLWAEVNVCVGVVGHTPTVTTATTTTARPTNGISTLTPSQDSVTTNCNKFYKAKSGDGCAAISQNKGISLPDLSA